MGGNVLSWPKRGSDTVPAMLTPGERVLSTQENRAYEAGGGMNTAALEQKMDRINDALKKLPKAIRDAVLLAS